MKNLKTIIIIFLHFIAIKELTAQDKKIVLLLEIQSEIDARTNRYLELGLTQAKSLNADIIIIKMDTYGGLLTDAKDMAENIMNENTPIWVFIDKDAASAGALISIACDSIYMSPGASIGAATVVFEDGKAAPDKYQSYMRSTMRSVAEEKGRNPQIAEGMVDENIYIEGVSESGQVITFSTNEAIKNGFCEAKVQNIEEIFSRNGVQNYELIKYELTTSEKIISYVLNPFISGILIIIILGGIWFELQTPGVGFPLLAALVGLILYFIPYYLNGLAENWELILFLVGLALIFIELLVIPGFGVIGILGLFFSVSSLILIMLNNDFLDFTFVPSYSISTALLTIIISLLSVILFFILFGVRFIKSRFFASVALTDTMNKKDGYLSNSDNTMMVGKIGIAYTILRPSGKIMIDNQIFDAYTRGEYIEKGTVIKVINQENNSLRVSSTSKS